MEPITAWLFAPGGSPEAVEGTLSLRAEERALEFAPTDGEAVLRIGLAGARVRRLRASPVLAVRYRTAEGPGRAFFYLTEPPAVGRARAILPSRRKARDRRDGVLRLRAENRRLRSLLEEWVRAIAEASSEE